MYWEYKKDFKCSIFFNEKNFEHNEEKKKKREIKKEGIGEEKTEEIRGKIIE